ncbi:MAG: ABC transporter permease subunit [Pirellulales bacterium]
MISVFVLHMRQMLADRRAAALLLFVALPLAVSLLLRFASDIQHETSREVSTGYLFMMYPQVMCELLALLYGSTLLGAELEAQTLGYLFTRPLARWRIVVAKYAATVATLIVPVSASLYFSWVAIGSPGDGARLLGGVWLGVVGSLVVYSSIFLLLGALIPARAMVLGLIYAMVEFALSFVPAVLNTFTVTYHLRTVVAHASGMEVQAELRGVLSGDSVPLAVLALALMACLGLAGACWTVSVREYLGTKAEGA